MDLAMILSPAPDEDATSPSVSASASTSVTTSASTRSYSSDELQCAVAILQDFTQPSRGSSPVREAETKPKVEPESVTAPVAPVRGPWGDDSASKLDLLVQADAELTRRTPAAKNSSNNSSSASSGGHYLRSGVWTKAEEEYAAALMYYFLKGLLSLAEGTTLRKFLAEQLCCNRRRVSMKLATEAIANKKIPRKVGASVFVALEPAPSDEERREMEQILAELRHKSFRSAVNATPGLETHHRQPRGHDVQLEEILQDKPTLSTHSRLEEEDEETEDEAVLSQTPPRSPFRLHSAATKRKTSTKASVEKPRRKKPTIIRTGFDSPEEEEYVTTMFEFFMAGVLDLPDGTKLVSYLCDQLDCTPKTLSMKLAPRRLGERKFPDNVGSITYLRRPSDNNSPNGSPSASDGFSEELFEMESRLRELRLACEDAQKRPEVSTPQKPRKGSAGSADSPSVASTGSGSAPSTPSASPVRFFSRSGPWSREEEVYAAALIDCFFKGVLELAEGTTLRAFLASRLCCNPMRISKKLASECIADIRIPKKLGSSTFVRRGAVTQEELLATEETLRGLQHAYLHAGKDEGNYSHSQSHKKRRRRSRPRAVAIATDPDATESDSDARKSEKSPDKRRRTVLSADAPERVLPAPLREQLA